MIMVMSQDNQPGLYAKGGQVRRAGTPADAVNLRWNGFVPVADQSVESTSYADLQSQARSVGVRANQSAEALVHDVAEADPDDFAFDAFASDPAPDYPTDQ